MGRIFTPMCVCVNTSFYGRKYKVCVTSLSVVARNRRMLLYKLNDDSQILKNQNILLRINLSQQVVTIKLRLMRDDSVYTVLGNNEIFTLLYDLCTL